MRNTKNDQQHTNKSSDVSVTELNLSKERVKCDLVTVYRYLYMERISHTGRGLFSPADKDIKI